MGVAYLQPLMKNNPLYLETGLYLAGRGAKYPTGNDDVEMKMNMLYLQVPILITQHFDYKNVSLQPAVGIYYGLGVSGKSKSTIYGMSSEADLFKDSEVDGEEVTQLFTRSDFGIRVQLGLAIYKHYLVALGYDFGTLNIFKEKEHGRMRNNNFYISLGYNF